MDQTNAPWRLLSKRTLKPEKKIIKLLNEWWNNEDIPEEILQSRVVLIFKKGDTADLDNYRPISLLNSIYKLYAAIIKIKLEEKLEQDLQEAQYGFRKDKRTAQAIHMIRRILEIGERKGTKINVVLLDWEKAFDKVSHESLFLSLERLNVSKKIINVIKSLYKNPQFKVEIDGQCSEFKTQETGIKQGCPLSPYLFLTIMTTIFHDIHKDPTFQNKLKKDRILGTIMDEILFADDTIIYSVDPITLSRLASKIENESSKYGLKLKYKKMRTHQHKSGR